MTGIIPNLKVSPGIACTFGVSMKRDFVEQRLLAEASKVFR